MLVPLTFMMYSVKQIESVEWKKKYRAWSRYRQKPTFENVTSVSQTPPTEDAAEKRLLSSRSRKTKCWFCSLLKKLPLTRYCRLFTVSE